MFQLAQAGGPARTSYSSQSFEQLESTVQQRNTFYNDLFYAQQLGSLCINIRLKESVFTQPCQILSQDGELTLELHNNQIDEIFYLAVVKCLSCMKICCPRQHLNAVIQLCFRNQEHVHRQRAGENCVEAGVYLRE